MNAIGEFVEATILEATWAERVGWALLHSLWQIALIAGVYAVVSAALRKRSAQGRYLLGCAAMLAMVAAPVATWVLLPGDGNPRAGERGAAAVVAETDRTGFAMETVAPRLVEVADVPPAVVPVPERAAAPVDAVEDPPAPVISSDLLRPWMPWATAAWLLGVCLLSMRPILGWLHIRRLQVHGLSPLSGSMRREAERLARRLGVTRTVRFLKSKLVEVPTVVGSLRPFVLLPASAVSGLSVAEIEMILAHELAHIRRHDYLVNLVQTVLEALLFFHPAMWWVSRQVRRERENCCDDIAVEVSGNRDCYVRALTHLEEQRTASHVAVLTATGGSLLGRVRRLLGQPGSEFGYRSVAAWLAGLVAVGLVSLALATGDAPQDKTGEASADDVENREAAADRDKHPVELIVREFLKAIASGDYDRAIGLSASGQMKREGLEEVGKAYNWDLADIAEGLVGGANAAVLTQRLAGSETAKPGQFGFHLVSEGDRWRIRDVDFLPDDQAVGKWLADFRRLEPEARPAEAGQPAADLRPDREVLLAYAHALESGDLDTLEQYWEFQDKLDRQFAHKLAAMCARAQEMNVELVSMQPMGEGKLFACFLMRDGPEGFGAEAVPHFTTFHRKDGRLRCPPPQSLHTIVKARSMGASQMGRRAITQQMISRRFGPQNREERIASRKAQADAFARLARPPYGMTGFEKIAEQMQVAIEREEKVGGQPWQELWRLTLEEHGKDALPRPGDFHLSFYLPADPDDPHARKLPFPGPEKTFLAEPFPCLTDEALVEASVESVPGGSQVQIAIRLTRGGASLFAAITRQSIRKRLAIVIDGKVVSAPEIMTEIPGGRLTVTGDFSRQEAEAMVKQLNSHRERARELLEGLDKEEDAGKQEADGQAAVNRIVQELMELRSKHAELARFAEDARHEVHVLNGAILVSLAYEHNYLGGTKNKPAGPKAAKQPWCRIALDIRPADAEPAQMKSSPVDAGRAIRWNGKSDVRSYRLGDPPRVATVSVEAGSDALRKDVNRIIDRELGTLIGKADIKRGGEFEKDRAGATGKTRPAASDGLEFLEGIPEFRELNMKMSEAELREIIHRQSLTHALAATRDDSGDYHLYTRNGENVIVMFRDGECGGIQRMRPDRDAAEKLFLAQGNAPDPYKKPLPPEFAGVTSITFHNDLGGDRFVEVTAPEEVRELIAAIELTPKEPCLCEHMWSATFRKQGAETRVAICDHCFDIQGAGGARHFRMSPEFFRLFAKHTGWPEEVKGGGAAGKAGDDVQVRLHSPQAQWDDGRWTLFFKIDLESGAERVLPHYGAPIEEFFLEVDGEWFDQKDRGAVVARSVAPSPAKRRENLHTRICAREWRSMANGLPMPEFAPGRHTVRVGFPLADEPDATGQRPRAVSNPLEIVTATKEVGANTIALRQCLAKIVKRIGELKERYRELEELDDVKLGGSIAASPDNPLHLGIEYSHKFDGWDKNKHVRIGDGGCLIAVRFGSPDNPSAMMESVPLPRFGKLVARYLVVVGEGERAGKFREAVTVVIIEELGKLRDGSPELSWGKPSDGARTVDLDARSAKISASEEQTAVEHSENAFFVARVIDADTGELIEKFSALAGVNRMEDIGWQWQPHTIHEFAQGRMQWPPPSRRGYEMQVLRIEADGYKPYQTPMIRRMEDDEVTPPAGATTGPEGGAIPDRLQGRVGEPVTRVVRLQRDPGVQGRALLPNGQPATGAQVAIAMAAREVRIEDGRITVPPLDENASLRDHWDRPFMTTTDDQGRFTLPTEIAPAAVIITHAQGIAAIPLADFPISGDMTLEPWGAIDGRVQWGELPGAGAKIDIGARTRVAEQFQLVVWNHQSVVTDDQGRFRAEKLPPGLAQVSHVVEVPGKERSSYRPVQFVEIMAGEPTEFVLGGLGRPVIGRLVGRDNYQNVRLRIAPNAPYPGFLSDPDDPEWEAYSRFMNSPAGKHYVQGGIGINADGTFRIENVLPETYQLFVTAPKEGNIGSAQFTIKTIPGGESDQAQDLGEIRVAPVEIEVGAPKVFADPNSKHDGVIRGRVVDPQPTAPSTGYYVMLWRESWERNSGDFPALVVGAGESFEFRNLQPGEYELRAREWRPEGRVVNWNTEWTPIVAEAAVVEGKVAEVQLVFGPDDTGRWSEAYTWGEAVDGVMMCITKSIFRIAPGEELDLRVEIYNGSKTDRRIALEHEAWELEVNGKWLKVTGGMEGRRRYLPLPAKQARHQVEVWPWLWENMTGAIRELPPGNHTIRVARLLNGEGRSPKDPPQIRIVSQPVTVEVVVAEEKAAPRDAGLPAEILPILQAMKQEVVKLGEEYPQLAGAKGAEVKEDGWLFEHDCRFMGKRGYEDTGPFPVAIGLRVMTAERFRAQVDKVAMSSPGYRWDYLGLVGWPTLHVGEGVPPVLVGKLQEVLRSAMVKIGPLNRQALAESLPRAVQQERDRLLAAADAKIRDGVRKLAETWPLLRKGQSWDRLEMASGPGRIGIHLHRTQAGKGRTDEREFPPSEAFSLLVVIKPPPDEVEQLVLDPLYPRLGLVGQVGTRAGNPDLDAALKKLVTEALAPLAELEARAGKPGSGPASVAPATSDSRRGQSEAEADLKAGRARYFHIGLPLSADSQLADILLKDYGLTLVSLGCVPVPPVGEHAKGYNETVSRALSQEFGRDFIKKAWEKDSALREEESKPKGPGKEVAPGTRATGDDSGPRSAETAPAAPPMPFDELKAVMKCNWWGTLRRELTIHGDGRADYAMVTGQNEAKYRAGFRLSGGQRESLVRALEATRWLELAPEKIMGDDAVEFGVELRRKGQTKRAEFMLQDKPPYHALEMFLNCLDRQEDPFYQLTASTGDHRVHAARDIQNALSSRMKRPGHAPAVHLKDLDYTRFVPVLIPWLKDRKNHDTDEMAAAIDLVGYLKLAEQREAVEALMGLGAYSDWNSVCECLVRLGDPRSIPVLKQRALKPGADAACWALIRMGAAAHDAICEVLRTPRVPNNNPAYGMVRVYLDHFHELPEPVAPAIVEAIRAARLGRAPISEYADRLLGLIKGHNPMLDLRVTIAPQKPEYAPGEPVLVKWKIENTGNEPRTILWHPLHYSPVVFSFKTAGGTEYDRADQRRNIVDELPAPPEPLVLQPGESHEVNIDLRHFLPDGSSTWVIAGYYWPRAKEAAIPAEFLGDPKFAGAMLERIGSGVTRIVVLPRPRTAEEEKREAERRTREDELLHREAEEAERRAMMEQG